MAKIIDNKRHELENQEKDNIYIFKETKNTAHINQQLINEYGQKAKNRSYDVSKYRPSVRIGKMKFFDPTDENYKKLSETKKLKNKGFLKLPIISEYASYDKKPLLTYNNSNIVKNKIKVNKLQKKEKIFQKNIKKQFSFESKKIADISKKIKNSDSNRSIETNECPSTYRNCKSDRNILKEIIHKTQKRNKFRQRNKNFYFSGQNIFSQNGPYLTTLSNFKEQLINEINKKRKYFDRNDYGCNLFKEKYTFINKKYFE
jgi:hypothetical protein